ncbi:RagB/SusD family nutrient uptake outer membrane protein [Chitinophaga oryziterrae]|uniref:RagB/SusD family nutrient uptake outer membrane protein n=1 Tax=Chitinophaga oryziterrae TaxID=1031224 RepID=A0A6N8JCR5_9BACT|nr:RagB/SusD family nutrient uptake outer membrane protein [Chitinophaga oryziterrae]MVT43000.1 RagB/SusD family nutrient uptake outer membrane protein [Chitinophaga oryziterrae]
MKRMLFFAGVVLLSGCSKFLDRQPLSQISPDNGFNSESELQLYVHSFYDNMLPNPDGEEKGFTSLYGETSNNIVLTGLSPQLTGNRSVPVSGGGWDWTSLRNVNYFIQNYNRGGLDTSITYKYVAVAKFFRAYFYANMVAHFGDVPFYNKVIETNDTASLNKPRDSRTLVMDSVLNDLDFAIAHLGTGKDVAEVTKWTALALKSRVCLFEGTFRKYHTEFSLPDANGFLQKSADAAQTIMNAGVYTIYKSSPEIAYGNLFSSLTVIPEEVILARQYSAALQIYHNVNYYTTAPSFGKPGLEKSLVNSYLMKDGSRFTDIPGYTTMQFYQETQNRDPRLSQTIRTPGYKRIDGNVTLAPSYGGTVTGYQLTKFVTSAANDALLHSYNPLPVIRYAEVLLNYAEAKAELGTITQSDLDLSIKLLRDRVAMPGMDMAAANIAPDPYLANQYTHVSGINKGIILEIRRERRIELVMEGFVWNDIMRWKEGHLLAVQYKGAYFPGEGNYDLDGDGATDLMIYSGTQPSTPNVQFLKLGTDVVLENGASGGNIIVNGTIPKTFNEERDYLFPLPTTDLLLNPRLTQNYKW